jgi:hypothetical protein
MATKNGLVESLVIRETATGPPAAAADEAGAAADEATAAADEATAAAEVATAAAEEDVLDEELPPQAARVTESAPMTAMPATAFPRVKR